MDRKDKTRLVHLSRGHIGREHAEGRAASVNPPLVRASTALYPGSAGMQDIRVRCDSGEQLFRYGASGTPTTFTLGDAITAIEGGERTMLFPTGLAAIAHPFLSILRPGDHLLLAETVYGPARALAEKYLPQRGINCEFYAGGHEEMTRRLKPETRMVYLDNPGSIIYDIQDVPAMAAALKGRETLLVVDNTWGAPGLYKPLELGADISIIAVTKYIAGHSDLVMGSVTANARCARQLVIDAGLLGQTVSPDDAFQALKGLRTAAARIAMIENHAREVIAWIQKRPEVERVLYPPLENDPAHALWKRDFKGGNGLFSIGLTPEFDQKAVGRFVDALQYFGIGASWGGFESLVMTYARIPGWKGNQLIRFHVGLEDPADIIADLERGFAAMKAA